MKNTFMTLLIIPIGFAFTQEFDVDGDLKVQGNLIFQDETTMNTAASGMPIGAIITFAGSTAPSGWLLCDGSELPADAEYDQLNSVLDGAYGSGSRSYVPDLRGRTAIGLDNMGGTSLGVVTNSAADNLGDVGGAESHALNDSETPNKYFTFSPGSASLTASGHSQACSSGSCVSGDYSLSHSGGTFSGPYTETAYHGSSYNSTPHNNMQPYLALNYIIKY